MKLATIKDGSRDGALAVVSRDLKYAVTVPTIAKTLQAALDDWNRISKLLREVSSDLNDGTAKSAKAFDLTRASAPLPRAFQWADGSAYLSHAELVRKARKAEMPDFLYREPLIYQGAGDRNVGPYEPILVSDESWGIDLEAEIAVITDDVPMGVTAARAAEHIKLVTILNDVSLRNLIPAELTKGFGFFNSKPATVFAAVAVTPDELGSAWDGTKLSLPLISHVNGIELGRPNGGVDLNFDFPTLISHAAKSRFLGAGTVVGSGTVSNRNRSVGSSCLAEKRMIEVIDSGSAKTPFLMFGDIVRIEMLDESGNSIFGAIEQRVEKYDYQYGLHPVSLTRT